MDSEGNRIKMKSGGAHRFSLNKQLKLPYELCFSQKTNQPKKFKLDLQSQNKLR